MQASCGRKEFRTFLGDKSNKSSNQHSSTTFCGLLQSHPGRVPCKHPVDRTFQHSLRFLTNPCKLPLTFAQTCVASLSTMSSRLSPKYFCSRQASRLQRVEERWTGLKRNRSKKKCLPDLESRLEPRISLLVVKLSLDMHASWIMQNIGETIIFRGAIAKLLRGHTFRHWWSITRTCSSLLEGCTTKNQGFGGNSLAALNPKKPGGRTTPKLVDHYSHDTRAKTLMFAHSPTSSSSLTRGLDRASCPLGSTFPCSKRQIWHKYRHPCCLYHHTMSHSEQKEKLLNGSQCKRHSGGGCGGSERQR